MLGSFVIECDGCHIKCRILHVFPIEWTWAQLPIAGGGSLELPWKQYRMVYEIILFSGLLSPMTFRQISNIRRMKSINLNVSRLVLQLSLTNLLKPGVKPILKMLLEQRRSAPVGAGPNKSEWSTISLPTKVRIILEIILHVCIRCITMAYLYGQLILNISYH